MAPPDSTRPSSARAAASPGRLAEPSAKVVSTLVMAVGIEGVADDEKDEARRKELQ